MTSTFCTLATGEKYVTNAVEFFYNLKDKTIDTNFLIATDLIDHVPENIKSIFIDQHPTRSKNGAWYNYNLKFLPIKNAIDLESEFIVFIDADWKIHDNFQQTKFFTLFNKMIMDDIDFVFERPHPIGASKRNWDHCFWRHKIKPYNLDVIDDYDAGHVCNEQILVFRNNEKLKIFCEFWEKLFWRSHEEEIWAFAEGVEIGMSSVVANFKWDYNLLGCLRECFHFYDILGNHWIRF
jgi:hypothetical protein